MRISHLLCFLETKELYHFLEWAATVYYSFNASLIINDVRSINCILSRGSPCSTNFPVCVEWAQTKSSRYKVFLSNSRYSFRVFAHFCREVASWSSLVQKRDIAQTTENMENQITLHP